MKIIEWDNDGYPTEESLEKLRQILNSGYYSRAYEGFWSALKENTYGDMMCGKTKKEVRGELKEVWQYHTGGWSGNEDIIRVLQDSPFWGLYLDRYDPGGHYYFKPKKRNLVISKEDKMQKAIDNVNHPAHYTSGGIETIDFIGAKLSRDGFEGYLVGNIIKYITRYKLKNGIEDLEKAQWYLDKLIRTVGKD